MRGGRSGRGSPARSWTGYSAPGTRAGDVATLLVNRELFVNSIRHSGSAARGETVTVAVKTANDVSRVEVTDLSGPGVPQLRPSGGEAEDGRGLHLVARLAARWGWRRRGVRTVTWFEIQALLQPMQHSAVSGKGLSSPDVGVSGVVTCGDFGLLSRDAMAVTLRASMLRRMQRGVA